MFTKYLGLLFVALFSLSLSQNTLSREYSAQTLTTNIFSDETDNLKSFQIALFQEQPIQIQDKSYRLTRNFFNDKKARPAGEKKIIINPNTHTWHAYSATGKLLRSGIATAGGKWCPDIRRSCKTKSGVFRVFSLGSFSCKSSKYPIERGGGAPMPYCMFFNGSQGLHGSYNVVRGNISHGCVRLKVLDAKWLRFNFITIGTKVIVKSY